VLVYNCLKFPYIVFTRIKTRPVNLNTVAVSRISC